MLAVLATKLFAGGQKRVNPRVVAVFHEQMGLEKSKTFLCKDFYYTAIGNSITHPFLVHVTIDRTADYRRTVWQVFCDLQTRKKQQYQCHNIYLLLPDILININNIQIYKIQKYAVHDPGIYSQFPNTCWCKSSRPEHYRGLIRPVRATTRRIRLAVFYSPQ